MSDYWKQTNRMDAAARAKGLSDLREVQRGRNSSGAYRLYNCGSVVMERSDSGTGIDPIKTDDFGRWF